MKTSYRLGELFCGAGGLALGALRAGDDLPCRITHTWATDYAPDACQTYRRNICPEDPKSVLCEDIRTLRMEGLPSIDALAFGFPCNDYSIVGEHKGLDGSFGSLYSYGVRALHIFQPDWFMAENVGGLKSANGGRALDQILAEMEEAGYRLTPYLYRFEDYGLPQGRHRIIIIGIRKDIGISFSVPDPTGFKPTTCREAIEDPPIAKGAQNHEFAKVKPLTAERLSFIKPGENAFSAKLPEHLRLNVKGATISQIYRRLDPERPAYTVTASGGGGTHMYHWQENRPLTNRERARLQTFPDSYVFEGNRESVRKQIGMAVPPEGARFILRALLKCLAGIPYPSIPASLSADSSSRINPEGSRPAYAGECNSAQGTPSSH